MSKSADILFEFVRALIYDTTAAELDVSLLDEEHVMLGKGLAYFADVLRANGDFALKLSNGDLSAEVGQSGLAAPLKALQASLRHLTWQTQQVADGDYRQRVEFMGEFSMAFNTMVEKLEENRASLEREIEFSHRKTKSLLRYNMLITNITANIPEPILVLDKNGKDVLYQNRAAKAAVKEFRELTSALEGLIKPSDTDHAGDHSELALNDPEGKKHYFAVVAYDLAWDDHAARAFLIDDVSGEREKVITLERHAYRDSLTGLHNRFFGMKTLNDYITAKRQFVLCFVDLDYLKYINDTFGHQEGDKYLIYVAAELESFAKGSLACRVGGDEFLVLAPDFTYASVEERLRQVAADIAAHNTAKEGGSPFAYSISYGIVELTKDNRMSPSDALSLADERMYQFKRKAKKTRVIEAPIDDRTP